MSMLNLFPQLHEKIPGSKYFTWAEALYLPQVKAYAVPDLSQQMNIIKLAVAMDRVREHFGKPIQVTSWLRPDAYNKLIGGAPFSFHKSGAAIDFVVVGMTIQEAKTQLFQDKNLWPYRGELDTTTWIHLDLGTGPWFNGMVGRKTK